MTLTSPFTQVFLPVAVVVVMFGLGTTLTLADLRRVLARPHGLIIGLAVHGLVLPGLAFGVIYVMHLSGPLAVGLVLIAACPANAAVNLLAHFARGDTMLSVCLTALASLTSVVTIPLFVNAALRFFSAGHEAVIFPTLSVALAIFVVASVPVLAGMRFRQWRPQAARAVEARLSALGLTVIVLIVVAAIWSHQGDTTQALLRAGWPALVLNFSAVALAWGLTRAAGLSRSERVAVSLECGLQNFAMAAFVALTLLHDATLLLPAIAYGVTMWLSAILLVIIVRRCATLPGATHVAN